MTEMSCDERSPRRSEHTSMHMRQVVAAAGHAQAVSDGGMVCDVARRYNVRNRRRPGRSWPRSMQGSGPSDVDGRRRLLASVNGAGTNRHVQHLRNVDGERLLGRWTGSSCPIRPRASSRACTRVKRPGVHQRQQRALELRRAVAMAIPFTSRCRSLPRGCSRHPTSCDARGRTRLR